MTEAQWLASADAGELLGGWPGGRPSDRRLRLFVCGCWREYHRQRLDGRAKRVRGKRHLANLLRAIEAGEATADGRPAAPPHAPDIWYVTQADPLRAAQGTAADGVLVKRRIPTPLLRDVLGNPFRPVALDPAWLTSDVLALAHGIYDDRAWDRLPILADALQDAGCDSDELLAHCRGGGPHVRGCWAVDLVLGRS